MKRYLAYLAVMASCVAAGAYLSVSPRATAQDRQEQGVRNQRWRIFSANHTYTGNDGEPLVGEDSILLDTVSGESWILWPGNENEPSLTWVKVRRKTE